MAKYTSQKLPDLAILSFARDKHFLQKNMSSILGVV
jgi:hypothetical protein